MGEIADEMFEGNLCEGCGERFIFLGYGYPRKCAACLAAERLEDFAASLRKARIIRADHDKRRKAKRK